MIGCFPPAGSWDEMNAQTFKDLMHLKSFEAEGEDLEPLKVFREHAFGRCLKVGLPESRSEDWKHTDLSFLLGTPFRPAEPVSLSGPDSRELTQFLHNLCGGPCAVLVNGVMNAEFSTLHSVPPGLILTGISQALRSYPERVRSFLSSGEEEDFFASVNGLHFRDGLWVAASGNYHSEDPVDLIFVTCGAGEPSVAHPRIWVDAGPGSRLRIRSFYLVFNNAPGLTNAVVDLRVGEDADVQWTDVRKDLRDHYQMFKWNATLSKKGRFNRVSFAGGHVRERDDIRVFCRGEEAFYELNRLSVLSEDSESSQFVATEHASSGCEGKQCYKSILTDRAAAEYVSRVHVCAHTAGNISDQLNRNLLLSEGARAYSRPQLMIDADAVRAKHGSATGELRENELFYLRSRGLSVEEAGRMLLRGFAAEIVGKIPQAGIRKELDVWLEENLGKIAAKKRQDEKRGEA
jgi:Fe-S cluster assembly protein SufD